MNYYFQYHLIFLIYLNLKFEYFLFNLIVALRKQFY